MTRSSRREFLQRTAAAAGLGLLSQLPGRRLLAATPGARVDGEADEASLRGLALTAVDAARAAGATFADVRFAMTDTLRIVSHYGATSSGRRERMAPPTKSSIVSYDIRALVGGAWGIAAGYDLTPDSVTRAARTAVAVAGTNRPRHRRTLDLAPAPVVSDGRWHTPVERDPFTVPIREQGELQLAVLAEVARVVGVADVTIGFFWTKALHVFASTEGSLIVQETRAAGPGGSVSTRMGDYTVGSAIKDVAWDGAGGYGYEVVADRVALARKIMGAAERWVALVGAARSAASTDVGRYDLVLGPGLMAQAVAGTLVPALNLERVLGYRANREGTSFAAPPATVLDNYQVASPLLTLHGNRSAPGDTATVGWDDEGIQPDDHTLIRGGVIVDYLTSRQSAPHLASIYARRGKAVRSHGCTWGSELGPAVRAPNLVMQPAPDDTSVEDLIAGTKRGFYLEGGGGATDQQLLNSLYQVPQWSVRRITNGKLGAHVRHFAIQFITPSFWKSLDGLGGAGSARRTVIMTSDPTTPTVTIRAVPGRFRQVNVLNTGGTA